MYGRSPLHGTVGIFHGFWVHMPAKHGHLLSELDQTGVVKSALFFLFLRSQQIVNRCSIALVSWSRRNENPGGRLLKLGPLVDRACLFPACRREKDCRAPRLIKKAYQACATARKVQVSHFCDVEGARMYMFPLVDHNRTCCYCVPGSRYTGSGLVWLVRIV